MTTAAIAAYTYDQIDQARMELNAVLESTTYEGLKTSSQTQSKFEGTFYATKRTDHPRGTAPGRAGQLVEETRARPRPASLAFRQMTRAST